MVPGGQYRAGRRVVRQTAGLVGNGAQLCRRQRRPIDDIVRGRPGQHRNDTRRHGQFAGLVADVVVRQMRRAADDDFVCPGWTVFVGVTIEIHLQSDRRCVLVVLPSRRGVGEIRIRLFDASPGILGRHAQRSPQDGQNAIDQGKGVVRRLASGQANGIVPRFTFDPSRAGRNRFGGQGGNIVLVRKPPVRQLEIGILLPVETLRIHHSHRQFGTIHRQGHGGACRRHMVRIVRRKGHVQNMVSRIQYGPGRRIVGEDAVPVRLGIEFRRPQRHPVHDRIRRIPVENRHGTHHPEHPGYGGRRKPLIVSVLGGGQGRLAHAHDGHGRPLHPGHIGIRTAHLDRQPRCRGHIDLEWIVAIAHRIQGRKANALLLLIGRQGPILAVGRSGRTGGIGPHPVGRPRFQALHDTVEGALPGTVVRMTIGIIEYGLRGPAPTYAPNRNVGPGRPNLAARYLGAVGIHSLYRAARHQRRLGNIHDVHTHARRHPQPAAVDGLQQQLDRRDLFVIESLRHLQPIADNLQPPAGHTGRALLTDAVRGAVADIRIGHRQQAHQRTDGGILFDVGCRQTQIRGRVVHRRHGHIQHRILIRLDQTVRPTPGKVIVPGIIRRGPILHRRQHPGIQGIPHRQLAITEKQAAMRRQTTHGDGIRSVRQFRRGNPVSQARHPVLGHGERVGNRRRHAPRQSADRDIVHIKSAEGIVGVRGENIPQTQTPGRRGDHRGLQANPARRHIAADIAVHHLPSGVTGCLHFDAGHIVAALGDQVLPPRENQPPRRGGAHIDIGADQDSSFVVGIVPIEIGAPGPGSRMGRPGAGRGKPQLPRAIALPAPRPLFKSLVVQGVRRQIDHTDGEVVEIPAFVGAALVGSKHESAAKIRDQKTLVQKHDSPGPGRIHLAAHRSVDIDPGTAIIGADLNSRGIPGFLAVKPLPPGKDDLTRCRGGQIDGRRSQIGRAVVAVLARQTGGPRLAARMGLSRPGVRHPVIPAGSSRHVKPAPGSLEVLVPDHLGIRPHGEAPEKPHPGGETYQHDSTNVHGNAGGCPFSTGGAEASRRRWALARAGGCIRIGTL